MKIKTGLANLLSVTVLVLKEALKLKKCLQGFSYLSEVGARSLLNLGKKFGLSKLGKFDAV